MKKIQKIARVLGFCVLLASVSVALNACSTTTTGDKTVIVKKPRTLTNTDTSTDGFGGDDKLMNSRTNSS